MLRKCFLSPPLALGNCHRHVFYYFLEFYALHSSSFGWLLIMKEVLRETWNSPCNRYQRAGNLSWDTSIISIFHPYHLIKGWSVMRRGVHVVLEMRWPQQNISQALVPAQQEVRQQEMSAALRIITPETDGSVLSAPNCSRPFFSLMNEERDSALSCAARLLAATVNLPLKVTPSPRDGKGEVCGGMEGGMWWTR